MPNQTCFNFKYQWYLRYIQIWYNLTKFHILNLTVKMKEFKCKICEKAFKSKYCLRKHFNHTHNNTGKDFNCNICTKSFQIQQTLASHIKIVHGGKPYNCKSCGKSFPQAGYLKKHIHIVHEGHKDYKCESCRKSFIRSEHVVWRNTSTQFMKATKITNMIIVVILGKTSTKFDNCLVTSK